MRVARIVAIVLIALLVGNAAIAAEDSGWVSGKNVPEFLKKAIELVPDSIPAEFRPTPDRLVVMTDYRKVVGVTNTDPEARVASQACVMCVVNWAFPVYVAFDKSLKKGQSQGDSYDDARLFVVNLAEFYEAAIKAGKKDIAQDMLYTAALMLVHESAHVRASVEHDEAAADRLVLQVATDFVREGKIRKATVDEFVAGLRHRTTLVASVAGKQQ